MPLTVEQGMIYVYVCICMHIEDHIALSVLEELRSCMTGPYFINGYNVIYREIKTV